MLEMANTTTPVNKTPKNLCYYQNTTNQIQIIRINPSIPQRFEKVLFPQERVLFYSTLDACLEIDTSTATGFALVDRIPCSRLQVLETEFYSGLQVC